MVQATAEVLSAAYSGEQWSPRLTSMTQDMASIWGDRGVFSEIGRLGSVLPRRPGQKLNAVTDFKARRLRGEVSAHIARTQHDALAATYESLDAVVNYVDDGHLGKPNAMFVRDLMLIPRGAMHVDGLLANADHDVAVIWPGRTPFKVVEEMRKRWFRYVEVEDERDAQDSLPLNFVAIA